MKRILLLLFMSLSVVGMMADELVNIVLSEEHPKQTTEYPGLCNIFVTMGETNNEDSITVIIQIENLSETSSILLFDHAYSEKNLKQMSIVFHKNFPGNKGNRMIDTSEDSGGLLLIEPGQKRNLPSLFVTKDMIRQCILPLYVAKPKEKKFLIISLGQTKMEILDKNIVKLNIKAELKDDEDFVRLHGEYEALMKELADKIFVNCPKNTHAKSLKKQEAPYQEKIVKLKESISSVMTAKGWPDTSKKYLAFDELKKKVDNIDLTQYEKKCEKSHPVKPTHNCQYCNLTLSQALKTMERTYKQLDTRKISKDAAIAEANRLYNACVSSQCPKLSDRWKKGGSEKGVIENYYNRIKNF